MSNDITYLFFFEHSNKISFDFYKKIINNGIFDKIKLVDINVYKEHMPPFIKNIPLLLNYKNNNDFIHITDINKINLIFDEMIEFKKNIELDVNETNGIDHENFCLYPNDGLNSFNETSSNDILRLKFEDTDMSELTNKSDTDKLIAKRELENKELDLKNKF